MINYTNVFEEVEILAFGIARDIFGSASISFRMKKGTTVTALISELCHQYPALKELSTIAIAVNATYAQPDQVIEAGDEVVIIPPVAGG